MLFIVIAIRSILKRKKSTTLKRKPFVKVYYGFGHTDNLVVFGHVLRKQPFAFHNQGKGFLYNLIQLLKLFLVKPLPYARLVLRFYGQVVEGQCEYDGFFRIEWSSAIKLAPGWHQVTIDCVDEKGMLLSSGTGSVWVPHVTQFAFISDIDDTILRSYSATVFRRLYELLIRKPEKRHIFIETVNHYKLLALAHTTAEIPNPVFYVSSSEWNLYDYLTNIFHFNNLPKGIFLLNQMKRWFELLKSGKTKHSGKLIRISRILEAFPKQKFVLLGDNSQQDPFIYKAIAERHPENIYAVYIRNVRPSRVAETTAVLTALQRQNIHVCLFEHSSEAISHGRNIGLLETKATLY